MTEPRHVPLVLLESRKPLEDRNQSHFYSVANEYDFIQARTQWYCMNPQCKVTLPYGRYYYKYKGSHSYWNYRRYGVWDRCCKLCYFDHVLNPKTDRWKNHMLSILNSTTREFENAIDKQCIDHATPMRQQT
jgi:hypothetical protein